MAYIGAKKLKAKLAAKGAKSPGGLMASIGRRKYGGARFQAAAAAGRTLKGAKPLATPEKGHITAPRRRARLLRPYKGKK